MNNEEMIELLKSVNKFLKMKVGIGEQYGTLGHDAGGILSHQILNNDPQCYNVNPDGTKIESTLSDSDYELVEQVWKDLNSVIDEGRNERFVERIEELIESLKKTS